MTQENKPVIQVKELFQAGIVVRDLKKSIELYEKLLGIGPWQIYNAGEKLTSLTYNGKLVENPSFLVGIAIVKEIFMQSTITPVSGVMENRFLLSVSIIIMKMCSKISCYVM